MSATLASGARPFPDELRRERGVVLVAILAIFAFSLQQTSVNPTLPAIQRAFGATTAWSTWVLTAFLLVGAVCGPIVGRLGDQVGRKPVLQATIGTFCLASLGAACAPNVWVLIACRGLSGVSGSFLALSLALSTEYLSPGRVGAAVGAFAASLAVGNIAGVTIAPWIADVASWRWMFAMVAFFAALALAVSVRAIPSRPAQARPAIDVRGATLLALAILSLMLALTEANAWGWGSTRTIALLCAAAVAGSCWMVTELRVAQPMIQLRVLARRQVAMTGAATFAAGFGVFAWFMLVPRMVATPRGQAPAIARLVHYGFGAGSANAGLYLLPAMVVALGAASALGPLTARIGWRVPFVASLVLTASGFAGLALWHERTWQILLTVALSGFAGPLSAIAAKLVADDVPPADHGLLAGLTMVTYYIGGVVGAQVCAAVLAGHTIAGTSVPTEGAFSTSFLICAVAMACAVPCAAVVGGRRRREPTGIMRPLHALPNRAQNSP